MDVYTLPDETTLGIGPGGLAGDVWSGLVESARGCGGEAYRDLHLRLSDFRQCFTRQLFADPDGAYGEFVREIVDQIRYGLLRDPRSLLEAARSRAMRKTADRVRSLTHAARVLSTLPKRHREVLIRAQLALGSPARLGREGDRVPVRRAAATPR